MTDQKKTRRRCSKSSSPKNPMTPSPATAWPLECMNTGDPTAADTHFRALLERNADYIPAYLMYGQLLARESRTAEAKHIL